MSLGYSNLSNLALLSAVAHNSSPQAAAAALQASYQQGKSSYQIALLDHKLLSVRHSLD
jgi:hypothetical protein